MTARRYALLPLRLIVGFGFMAHGVAKLSRGPAGFGKLLHYLGVPFPVPTAWAVTLLEIFGGFAILAGAMVLVVSVPLIVSLLVALFTVHLRYGFSSVNTVGLTPAGPLFGPPGYEIDLLYIAALVALAVGGPGALSVDGLLARRRNGGRQAGLTSIGTPGTRTLARTAASGSKADTPGRAASSQH